MKRWFLGFMIIVSLGMLFVGWQKLLPPRCDRNNARDVIAELISSLGAGRTPSKIDLGESIDPSYATAFSENYEILGIDDIHISSACQASVRFDDGRIWSFDIYPIASGWKVSILAPTSD